MFLVFNYRSVDDESIGSNGNTIFTLAVGSFGFIAGIFGCVSHGSRKWFKYIITFSFQVVPQWRIVVYVYLTVYSYAYLATSLAVVVASVMYFLAGYWDFYAAVKESGKFYYITYNNDPEELQALLPQTDEVQFWLQACLFLCVIVLALFSLAGMAIVASYRFCNRTQVLFFLSDLSYSGKKTNDMFCMQKEDYRTLLIEREN